MIGEVTMDKATIQQIRKDYKKEPFLVTDKEREIVSHMCIRLADKFSANIEREFVKSKFYRFISLIEGDLDLLINHLMGIIKDNHHSKFFKDENITVLEMILSLKDFLSKQILNSVLKESEHRTLVYMEAQVFQYDVPVIFLQTYGLSRLFGLTLDLEKYISVMPELEQLLEV